MSRGVAAPPRRGRWLLSLRQALGLALISGLLLLALGARAQEEAAPTETPVAEAAPAEAAPAEAAPAEAAPAEAAPAEAPRSLATLVERPETVDWGGRVISLLGLFALLGIAWLLSSHRRLVPWRVIAWGVALQLLLGVFVIRTDAGKRLFAFLNQVVMRLQVFIDEGSGFLFGDYLTMRFSFVLNVLPTIIFFSSLMTVLYHLGLMQRLVHGVAWVMQRTMRTSGSETLSAAANIFVGQTEAPLLVKPFVSTMTRSELMAVMTGGFATVAGGVMMAYVAMLSGMFPDIAGHLIAASVMSAPAALVVAKAMIPETEVSRTAGSLQLEIERPDVNVIDAAARGAGEGLTLALNVGAMLLAFIALVALLNALLGLPAGWHNDGLWAEILEHLKASATVVPAGCEAPKDFGALQACLAQVQGGLPPELADQALWTPFSIQRLLGWVFWPVAWVMGVPAQDCTVVAQLLGEKLVLNEFYAYHHFGELLKGGVELSYRSVVITTYALCGFANFGSIAIQIGGIGGIAPERRHDLARLGLRAMIAGTLAAFMTATVAGMLV
ncbi:MAG: nucleoside transporter C-terminal domain-containing protein [Deltaproteobacteria bacterium]|nr:nucleoside transporter C-terminal domain-containing protein [Deltaproteobacteria bacterium]